MSKTLKPIPPSVVRRLTKYLAYVQDLHAAGEEWVSSGELAEMLGLTSSTVRQDLTHVDFSGISKRGYATDGLKKVLERVLGADTQWNTIVVGAGNLGRALATHQEFARRAFRICGIFDSDEKKIGKKVGPLTVESMQDMPRLIGERNVDIGMIAVPSAAGQRVADLMIASGIHGLLNLSPSNIIAPRRVAVVDARIVASLQELSHLIKMKRSGG